MDRKVLLEDLNFIDLGRPKITKDDFEQFEQHFRIFVPDELKQLFLKMNECILEYSIVECESFPGGVMPELWSGLGDRGMNYLIELYDESLGQSALPFCRDPGGNIFIVRMQGEKQSGVYYLDLDEMQELDGKNVYATHWVADSLEDFAAKLGG